MTKEVMIRFCVGSKGSRKGILEAWTTRDEYKAQIEHVFRTNQHITLAQVFDEYGDFIEQYERIVA